MANRNLQHTSSPLLKALLFLPAFIFLMSCSGNSHKFPDNEAVLPVKALRELNATIARAPYYRDKKVHELDSTKALIGKSASDADRQRLAIELAECYRQVNADSAIYYGSMAVDLISPETEKKDNLRGRLSLINAFSTAGLFLPAIQSLDSVTKLAEKLPEKIEVWKTSRMLYSYMLAYVQDHGKYADRYRSKYLACDDSLLRHLPADDGFRRFIYCERLVNDGRLSEAKTNLESLMGSISAESNLYGMAAFQLAEVYKDKGDFRGYALNLALAAESDIKGCVREGIALPTLANWLYSHGDLDNAFKFINFALEDANSGNIRMRTVTIASLMPVIDEAYRKKIDDSRNMMTGYFLVSTALFLVALALIAIMVRGFRKIKANEAKLSYTSKKLEAYVGNFIGLCSNYASRLEQLIKLVTRKINAGQSDDLVKLIGSGRFNDDNDEFYQLIDKAVLDIFPDFVENINTLLKPDMQIQITKDEPLTPELRIYAFVRLGVDQSTRIAQILNYSVNTVYAYRNRMRNRAIDRDNFDAEVGNLGTSFVI